MKRTTSEHKRVGVFLRYTAVICIFSLLVMFVVQQVFRVPQVQAQWYGDAWGYRVKLTVDHTKVGADQTDFPIYVDLSMLPTGFHQHVNQTDARDIRVTKADGTTELPREVVFYDAAMHTGELHIKYSGTLSSSTDTAFYIYYGNPAASDYSASATYGKNNVWDSSFKAVLHLNQASTGTANEFADSTSNANSLSGSGTASRRPAQISGKMNFAENFSASAAQYITQTSASNLGNMNASQTVSLWYKVASNPSVIQDHFCLEDTGFTIHSCMYFTAAGNIGMGSDWNSPFTQWISTTAPAAGSWHHMVWTWNGTTNRLYVDGTEATNNTTAVAVSAAAVHLWVGAAQSSNDTVSKFDGSIDEVQFSTTTRSATWISTQYNNENNPGTFFTSQAKEEKNLSPVLSLLFDEGTGTTTYDTSSNAYNGTLSGATTPSWQTEDQCIAGKCLFYNGTTAYTSISPSVPSVQTISFWVRPKTNGETLVDLDGGTHYLSATSGTITATGFSSPTIYVNGVSGGSMVANTWQHVEVTTATAFAATAITIGKRSTNFLTGFVDEFRVYDYARTAAQVKSDFASRGSQTAAGARIGPDIGNTLSNGLVGYWKMDETSWTVNCSTTSVSDSSGNNNNGTACPNSTGPSGGRTGEFGSGGYFDGSDDYVLVNDSNSLDVTNTFTFSAWVNASTISSGDYYILDKDGVGTDTTGAYGFFLQSGGRLCYETNNQGDGNVCTASNIISSNRWYHVVATYDASVLNKPVFYVNGVQQSYFNSNTTVAPSSLSTNVLIGRRGNSGSLFNGYMDDIRIYNRTLSPAEVRQLYAWAPGPVGWWKMDENSGSQAKDSSGNGYTGTLTNSPNWSVGKIGSSINFDGVDDYVDIGDSFYSDSLTISAWIYLRSLSASQSNIVVKRNGSGVTGGTNEYELSISSTGKLKLQTWDSVGVGDTMNGNLTLNTNTWYHVSISYPGNGMGTASMYINGVLDKQQSFAYAMVDSTSRIQIGARSGNNDTRYFNGFLDDVKIYKYARLPSQVVEDMNGGHPPGGSPVESDIIHWKFDEASGATANNAGYGGSGYNGTISGATWYPGGKVGSAIATTTSTNYVSAGDQAFVDNLTGMTVGMWVKPVSLATSKALISKSTMSTQNSFAVVTDTSASDEIRVHIPTTTSDTGTYFLTSNLDLSNDTWSYLNVIYNASESASTRVRVYKNGKEISGSVTGTLPDKMTTGTTSLLKVGASDSGSFTALNGVFDDVKIYPYALTYDQMLIDYNGKSALQLGALSTDADGTTASNSASREFCVPGDTTSCAPPIGWWKFDENTGSTANNSAGTLSTGSLGNGTAANSPIWVNGKLGSGVSYDGVDDGTIVSDNDMYSFGNGSTDGSFTLSMWIFPTNNVSHYMMEKSTEWRFRLNSLGRVACSITDNSVSATLGRTAGSSLTENLWHHIVCTYDGTAASTGIKIYVDGMRVDSVDDNSGTGYVAMENSTAVIRMGTNNTPPSAPTQPFVGRQDDIKIYSYSRTPSQIAREYNRGAPIAWYKFDECTGSTAYNSAPTATNLAAGNNGTITIGATGTYTLAGSCSSGTSTESRNGGTTGKYGASLALDGTDDYATVSDTADLRFDSSTQDFSLFAWVKRGGTGTVQYIISKEDADNDGYRLQFNADNTLTCSVNATDITSSSTITDTTGWHFVGCVLNRSGNGQIYIDGNPNGSAVSVTSLTMATTAGIRIGARAYTVTNYFNGLIDDVRLYNYALTATQVKTLMNEGSAVRFGP